MISVQLANGALVIALGFELQFLKKPLGFKLLLGIKKSAENKNLLHPDRGHLFGKHHQGRQDFSSEKGIHHPCAVLHKLIGNIGHNGVLHLHVKLLDNCNS